MKLLKLHIGDLFRSLHSNFSVEFHKLDDKGFDAMQKFQPFCFAGLNGSGKSNVLEALAAIFYHLECCVAKFKPATFQKHFRPDTCSPDAFKLEYLIGQHDENPYAIRFFEKITIEKEKGKAPRMFRQKQKEDFVFDEEKFEVSLEPTKSTSFIEPAAGNIYLPDIIVGYSSGENEILSLPFIKSRLIHFDEYKEAVIRNFKYEEPESSLVYIDNQMSQAVLLTNLIFENPETTLKPLENELGIIGLRSFRMNLNMQSLYVDEERTTVVPILQHLHEKINALKKCSTSWFEEKNDGKKISRNLFSVLTLDFFIDDETKKAFREHFKTSLEMFRFFQVLYELNANIISEEIKEEAYQSRGFYTDGKLPVASPADSVFYFLDFMILKKIKGIEKPKELLLREFSDGEHQFLHTMGICLMLKDRRALLLLDEPETHFNPGWRAKFIKVLSDSIKAGNEVENKNGNFNIHLLKDILLTSHSPFIISDCLPNNVVFFKRSEETNLIEAKTASQLGFNTYGTSVEIILDELFEYNQSIGDLSNDVLTKIDFKSINSKKDVENTKKLFSHLGESIEKDLVLAKLNQLKFAD